jgi:hypothetical protein
MNQSGSLQQILGLRPVLPGQQHRGTEQRGRAGPDEVLERHDRLRPGPHTFFTTAGR